MNIAQIMTSRPVVVYPDESIQKALHIMSQAACHHLPVISTEKHLIGILSIVDCRRTLSERLQETYQPKNTVFANSILVSSAMTPAPITVEPDTPIVEAARLMLEHSIGCLPVMRGETLIGIVTRSDLLIAFIALVQKPVRSTEV